MIGKIKRILLYLFLSSFLYVLITKFVDPPITVTQLTNAFGLGLHRDYVSWDELGYQSKLAAIASEDQLFAEHIGFDFDAIEKSLLDRIVTAAHAKQAILVGDLISLSDLGSQATLHGRLKNLTAMGYIKMVSNEVGRKKEVLPTKTALKRYEDISKCLEKALKLA